MKIAFLSTVYPFRGGMAQFGGAMYHALKEKNEIKAYTFSRQYPSILYPGESQYVKKDDNVPYLHSEPVLDSIGPFSYITTAHHINLYNPDLLLMTFWLPFFGPSLGSVARLMKKNTKIISVLHNVIPHEKRPMDREFTSYFLSPQHGFITLTESVKQDLLQISPKAKCIVLPHPLYEHFGEKTEKNKARQELSLPENKKLLLYFGYIRDYKGLDILIESLSKLPEDYHLVLAGESYGDFTPYLNLIEKFGVKERITLLNRYIPDKEVNLLFSAADLCVLSYKSATQSGVTGIALHFDLPLVVTNVGGLKETVIHDQTGMIAESPNADLVTEQINRYFEKNNPEFFKTNIRAFKEELSWNRFAEKLIQFAQEV